MTVQTVPAALLWSVSGGNRLHLIYLDGWPGTKRTRLASVRLSAGFFPPFITIRYFGKPGEDEEDKIHTLYGIDAQALALRK